MAGNDGTPRHRHGHTDRIWRCPAATRTWPLDTLTQVGVNDCETRIDTAPGVKASEWKPYLVLQLRTRVTSWTSRG